MTVEIGARITGINERRAIVTSGPPPTTQEVVFHEVTFATVGTPGHVGVFAMPFFDPAMWPQFEIGVTYTITVSPPS